MKISKSTRYNQLKLCLQVRNSILMYFWPKNFKNFSRFLSLNQKWPKSDFFGLKLILNTFNENFKKYSLESVETLFQVRNSILMYFWPKNFENFSRFSSFHQKWPKSDFFGLKLILNTFNELSTFWNFH